MYPQVLEERTAPPSFFQNCKNIIPSYTSAIIFSLIIRESCKQASIHCSVFGDVLIHDTLSGSEGAQALNIYINQLID
jgi:hypothetical protein